MRHEKNIKFKQTTTPRTISSKHIELIRNTSSSHRFEENLKNFAFPDDSPKLAPLHNKKSSENKPEIHDFKEERYKLEVSRSLNNSPIFDVLDSLVRFEGDSEDIDKKNSIQANPNVDLKIMFLDEQHPDWIN